MTAVAWNPSYSAVNEPTGESVALAAEAAGAADAVDAVDAVGAVGAVDAT